MAAGKRLLYDIDVTRSRRSRKRWREPRGSRQSNRVRRGGRPCVPSNRNERRFTFPQAFFSPDEERFADETRAAAQAGDVVLAVHELQSRAEEQALPPFGQRPYSRLSESLRCSRPLYFHSCELPRPYSAQLCSHLRGLQPRCLPPLCSHSCGLLRLCSAQLCSHLRGLRLRCLRSLCSHSFGLPLYCCSRLCTVLPPA